MLVNVCSQAQAGLIEYTDRTSFLASAGNTSTIGFEGIAPAGGSTDTCGRISLGGVQFEGFISTDAIDSVQFRTLGDGSNSSYGLLDNFTTTASEASSPEPNTLILLGISIGLVGGIRRRMIGTNRKRTALWCSREV